MIYQSPYETTIGKVLNIKGVEEKIRTALAQNYPWIKVDENNRTILIYPNDIIPKFDHPVVVDLGRNLKYVATDLTAFVREMQPGEYTVGNRSLYTLQTLRSGLTSDLVENGPRAIKSLSQNAMKTYSDLITNAISMVFHCGPDDIVTLRVLGAWLYYSMLSEQEVIGDLELQAVIAKLSRDINIPATYISRYVNGLVYKSVDDFIKDVHEKIDNPTLKGLNIGMFYTTIAKNLNSAVWVGLDKMELLSISMEHIPTFIAVLAMCLTEQPFKNAGLTKIALRNFSRDKQQFVLGVNGIVTGR